MAAVVDACHACAYVDDVVVVDDGSTDSTADKAAAAGARVVRREAWAGSKADAMYTGVKSTNAELILFVDADCLGLSAHHLDEICRPVVEGRADMSVGIFDYGPIFNPLLRRMPPITGERILRRDIFRAVPPEKRQGWKIEMAINEVVVKRRLRTVARTMEGVTHRTKREKLGRVEGYVATWRMFREVLAIMRRAPSRAYRTYLKNLTVE